MKKIVFVLLGLFVLALSVPAFAHFQMLYTPEIALEKGGQLNFKIVWTHPFADEHTMEMTTPAAFYVLSQRGEGKVKKKDLKDKLKPINWTGKANSARAKAPGAVPVSSRMRCTNLGGWKRSPAAEAGPTIIFSSAACPGTPTGKCPQRSSAMDASSWGHCA